MTTAPAAATVITATVDRVGDEDLYSWGGPQDWSAAQPMENAAGGYALHPVLHYTRSVAAGSTSVPFESHIDGSGPDVVIAYDPAWRSGPYVVTFSAPGYTTSTPLLSDETGGI